MFTKKKSSLYYRNVGENAAFRLMRNQYMDAVEALNTAKERFDSLKIPVDQAGQVAIDNRLEDRQHKADMAFEQFLHVANGRGIRVKKTH